jgi:hypothetical protein
LDEAAITMNKMEDVCLGLAGEKLREGKKVMAGREQQLL